MIARIIGAMRGNFSLASGTAILIIVLSTVVFGPSILRSDPLSQDLVARLRPGAWAAEGTSNRLLGTDALGRDMVSRLMYGGRVSVALGVVAVTSSGLVGLTIGLMAGYFGGAMDDVIMRIAEIQMAFPLLVLALILMAVFGPGIMSMFVAFTISGWPIFAKITRGIVLSIREQEFIEAARAIGCSNIRIIIRHILPNVLPYIIVLATLQLSGMILTEAGLSFVGIGIQPPTPSWGNMLGEGRAYLSNAWWLATFPGIALMITVLGANLLSDGLQLVVDPRARTRVR